MKQERLDVIIAIVLKSVEKYSKMPVSMANADMFYFELFCDLTSGAAEVCDDHKFGYTDQRVALYYIIHNLYWTMAHFAEIINSGALEDTGAQYGWMGLQCRQIESVLDRDFNTIMKSMEIPV